MLTTQKPSRAIQICDLDHSRSDKFRLPLIQDVFTAGPKSLFSARFRSRYRPSDLQDSVLDRVANVAKIGGQAPPAPLGGEPWGHLAGFDEVNPWVPQATRTPDAGKCRSSPPGSNRSFSSSGRT